MNDPTIIEQTRAWVSSVIVGYNFCPFARREVERHSIRYHVSHERRLEECLHTLASEWHYLDEHPDTETSLLIFAESFTRFDDYLDMLDVANHLLVEQGYEGVYQLASFHPDYCFEGSDDNDAANYTNRSPYPMLHIIREASLEQALANYPNPESIPERNVELARKEGIEIMREKLAACKQRENKE